MIGLSWVIHSFLWLPDTVPELPEYGWMVLAIIPHYPLLSPIHFADSHPKTTIASKWAGRTNQAREATDPTMGEAALHWAMGQAIGYSIHGNTAKYCKVLQTFNGFHWNKHKNIRLFMAFMETTRHLCIAQSVLEFTCYRLFACMEHFGTLNSHGVEGVVDSNILFSE